MKIHELKICPLYYIEVVNQAKKFEIRKNDRSFEVGDALILREYVQGSGYTGRKCYTIIDYILSDFIGLSDGYVAMSIRKPKVIKRG